MHKNYFKQIVFRGKAGKIAIKQILNAEPVRNQYTTTVRERSKAAILNYKALPSFYK